MLEAVSRDSCPATSLSCGYTQSGVRAMLCACSGADSESNREGYGCRLVPTVQLLTLQCSVHLEAGVTANTMVHPGSYGLDVPECNLGLLYTDNI